MASPSSFHSLVVVSVARSGEFVDDVLEARNSVSDNVKGKSVYIHVDMVKNR
jgi:hypothetical protein